MRTPLPGGVLTYFDDGCPLTESICLTYSVGESSYVRRPVRSSCGEECIKWTSYSPTGTLPFLEDGEGNTITCPTAILQYAATRGNGTTMPDDEATQEVSISIQSCLEELLLNLGGLSRAPVTREEVTAVLLRIQLLTRAHTIEQTRDGNGGVVSGATTEPNTLPPPQRYLMNSTHPLYIDISLYCVVKYLLRTKNVIDAADIPSRIMEVWTAVDQHEKVRRFYRSAEPSEYVLMYFNMSGTADPIRWAFGIADIPYEDRLVAYDEWPSLKSDIPGGVLPVLQINEKEWLTESLAILLHVADKANLLPEDPIQFAHAYSICITGQAHLTIMRNLFYQPKDQKPEAIRMVSQELFPPVLEKLEHLLAIHQSSQGYAVGNKLSFADLHAANIYNNLLGRFWGVDVPNLHLHYPRLKRLHQIVLSHPIISKKRISQYPKPTLNYFEFTGRAECIRRIFAYSRVDFDDIRIPREDWIAHKKSQSATEKMPFIQLGNDRIYEVIAVLLYAAELCGLLPKSIFGRAHARSIYSCFDNCRPFMRQIAHADPADTEEMLAVLRPKFIAECTPVDKLVAIKQNQSGYCVDNTLTYIDFYITYEIDWALYRGMLIQGWTDLLPHIAKTHHAVKALNLD